MHNEELHNLYPSPDIIRMRRRRRRRRRKRWAGNIALIGEEELI
jgi:hypothetical protein